MSCHWQPTANQRRAPRLMGFSNNSRSQPAMMTMTSVTMTSTMTPPSRRDVISISHTCAVCGLSAVRRTDFIILYFIFWRSHRIYWYCICCCCNFNSHILTVIIALNAAVTLHICSPYFIWTYMRLYFVLFPDYFQLWYASVTKRDKQHEYQDCNIFVVNSSTTTSPFITVISRFELLCTSF